MLICKQNQYIMYQSSKENGRRKAKYEQSTNQGNGKGSNQEAKS